MKFNNFLRILADQSGNLLNIDELTSSVGITRETVYDYLALLEGTYTARRLAPFFRNLRSELTKMPKIFCVCQPFGRNRNWGFYLPQDILYCKIK